MPCLLSICSQKQKEGFGLKVSKLKAQTKNESLGQEERERLSQLGEKEETGFVFLIARGQNEV